MPICRLQKNHALTRRGGPSPALSPHPSPTPNDASKAKQRKVYIPKERTLSRFSLSFSFCLSLFLPFLYRDGPRLFRAISFVLLARINSSLRFPSLTRTRRRLLVSPTPSHCLCLSLYPTHPPFSTPFHSFSLSMARLVRSLAHMRANEID